MAKRRTWKVRIGFVIAYAALILLAPLFVFFGDVLGIVTWLVTSLIIWGTSQAITQHFGALPDVRLWMSVSAVAVVSYGLSWLFLWPVLPNIIRIDEDKKPADPTPEEAPQLPWSHP